MNFSLILTLTTPAPDVAQTTKFLRNLFPGTLNL
ncbi:hypothetical protein HMPREF0358_2499 [Escherichia coli 83972]|nr:hypothetical protein HMPREF0358_2499 [Escherichia coli 83972]